MKKFDREYRLMVYTWLRIAFNEAQYPYLAQFAITEIVGSWNWRIKDFPELIGRAGLFAGNKDRLRVINNAIKTVSNGHV